jgi:hypothetical protein
MASARKAQKGDRVMDAAVEYFCSRSHDAWRRTLLKTNPEQKGKPRMRERGGIMVDVNQPWSKLHPKAKADNKRAAQDAYRAVKRFPADREAASNFVHERWIARNKGDGSQPKALFRPYSTLPEVEKDKDRAHVDAMKKALAATRKRPAKKAKAKAKPAPKTVQIDAKTWARLEASARALSKSLGRPVPAEVLANAGIEAFAAVLEAYGRSKKA